MHLRIKLSSADAQMGIGFVDEIRIDLIRAESVPLSGPVLPFAGVVLVIAAWFLEGQHNQRNCQRCHGDRVIAASVPPSMAMLSVDLIIP